MTTVLSDIFAINIIFSLFSENFISSPLSKSVPIITASASFEDIYFFISFLENLNVSS